MALGRQVYELVAVPFSRGRSGCRRLAHRRLLVRQKLLQKFIVFVKEGKKFLEQAFKFALLGSQSLLAEFFDPGFEPL